MPLARSMLKSRTSVRPSHPPTLAAAAAPPPPPPSHHHSSGWVDGCASGVAAAASQTRERVLEAAHFPNSSCSVAGGG